MNIKTIVTLCIVALLSTSCNFDISLGRTNGNGEVTTEERPIGLPFTKVRGSAGLDIYLMKGDEPKIVVEADSNLQNLITSGVDNGTLKIGVDGNIGSSRSKKVYVTYENLVGVDASSGANVIAKDVIKAETVYLECSSGANLTAEVFAKETYADASSGADLKVSGKTSILNVDASSGSDIKAKDLESITCRAEASSGADVTVNVRDNLEADPSSGGDIRYYGNAEVAVSNNRKAKSVRKM